MSAVNDISRAAGPPEVPEPAELLDQVQDVLNRYVVMNDYQRCALALWVLHTHAFDAAESTMYVSVSSAEKQCGKTRLIETLELLVANPWAVGKVTAAVLARKIEAERPTLMLDEIDAAFGGDAEFTETLRGILNTGIRTSGKTTVCVTRGNEISYDDFSTFCPKLFAGIGNRLPDTIQDRSVNVRLTRRTRDEPVQRFRHREAKAATEELQGHLDAWADEALDVLTDARPDLPDYDALSDRALDGWEPLLAIADLAGGPWPQRAREAAVALAHEGTDTTISQGVQLLADVHDVFNDKEADALASRELAAALNAREDRPWGAFHNGDGIRPRDLATRLKAYEVRPDSVRIGNGTPKGYKRDQFLDAWDRYLPPPPGEAQRAQHAQHDTETQRAKAHSRANVADVADVADSQVGGEGRMGKRNTQKRSNPLKAGNRRSSKRGPNPFLQTRPITTKGSNHE